MSFAFPLSTTGAIAFADHLVPRDGVHAHHLDDATAARAAFRAVLKDDKRTPDGQRDPAAIVAATEAYLPYLGAILRSLESDDLLLRTEPSFSWRPALTHSLLPSAPRQPFPSFQAEHVFVLYTYLSALTLSASLLARSQAGKDGAAYELSPSLPAAERKNRDEHVGRAAEGLCRAAGVAEYLVPLVGAWERDAGTSRGSGSGKGKLPVEGSRAFASALAKLLLADAQLLSIRKLLSPTLASSPHVGPPLAKGHPSPSLLAKLYLSPLALYSQALSLLTASSSSRAKGSEGDAQTDPPIADLVKYARANKDFVQALARKWLGVDAGESSGGERTGEAIAWLRDAKATLADGASGGGGALKKATGGMQKANGSRWREELDSVNAFLSAYEKSNNSVYFAPIPPIASLLPRIPAGRSVLNAKPYMPPRPVFGPGSEGYEWRGVEGYSADGLEGSLGGLALDVKSEAPSQGYY